MEGRITCDGTANTLRTADLSPATHLSLWARPQEFAMPSRRKKSPQHERKRSPDPRPWPGWRFLPFVLAAVPLLYLIRVVVRFRVDVPFWDEWDLVPLVGRSYEGSFAWPQLWAWHNEHRIFFPRAILLLLVRATGWNVSYELAANLLVACGICTALVWQLEHSRKAVGDRGPNWLIPVVSAMVFSLNQWGNWLCGWQISFLLNVCAVIAGLVVLASAPLQWWRLPLALVLGLVASYSLASGLVYWPVGLIVVGLRPGAGRREKRLHLAAWALSGAAVVACYLHGFRPGPYHTPLGTFLREPAWFAGYVLTYLGAPMSREHAMLAGALGLLALPALALVLLRQERVRLELLMPYLGLSGYAAISAGLTGTGRMSFGIAQALSSRYIVSGNLLWISDLALLYLLVKTSRPPRAGRGIQPYLTGAGVAAVALLACCALRSSKAAKPDLAGMSHRLAAGRAALLAGGDDEALRLIHPNPKALREKREVLKRYHLSVFRQAGD